MALLVDQGGLKPPSSDCPPVVLNCPLVLNKALPNVMLSTPGRMTKPESGDHHILFPIKDESAHIGKTRERVLMTPASAADVEEPPRCPRR